MRKSDSPEALEAKLKTWHPNTDSWEQLGDSIFVPAVMSDLAGQLMVRGSEAHVIQLDDKDKPPFLDLPWAEAIDEFKARGIMKPTELSTLMKDYAQRADKARQLMLGQVQTFVRSELEKSLAQGGTFKDFSKAIDSGAVSLGITNDDPAYLNMVFRTNVQSAYGAGRYRAMTDPDVIDERPYAEYRTVGDARVRAEHAVLDKTVYALASDTWKRICPPNSYNCRCSMVTLTREEAKGRDVLDDVPTGYAPTPGFDGPPIAKVNAPTPKLAPALQQKPLPVPDVPVAAPEAPSAVPVAPKPQWLVADKLDVVSSKRPSDSGVNPAEILTLRTAAGEQKVIWKPDKGSEPIKSLKIGAASLSQREQAAYEIDQAIHGSNGTVPPTVARKRDGIVGTMQMFAPDGARGGMSFEDELRKEPEKFAAAAQPVFLTDTITRNIDRHSGNILWSKVGDQYKPHAIDNGAAFGSGPSSPPFGFRWPVYDHRYIESSLRFSPETQATARAMDIEQLAAALAKQDKISRVQKIEALARAASLRKDPAQLTTFADRDEAAIRAIQDADLTDDEKHVNVMTAKLEEWLSRAPKKRNLTAEELAEIERLIP